jgi:hypothetical protein
MRRQALLLTTLAALSLPAFAGAQDPRDLSVKTFRLRNLRPEDAAKLLGPYVNSPGGGVFEAGSIGAITVRETSTMLVFIDSLLRVHDRDRARVSMRFQLIAALDTAHRDPAIAGIDAELRKLFRFAGYELIGEGTALTEEMSDFTMTLSTRARPLGGERISEAFQIRGWIEGVQGAGDARTVRITVTLRSALQGNEAPELLRTGLSMPAGQSVILGSARPTMTFGSRVALILVVQPEVSESARQ